MDQGKVASVDSGEQALAMNENGLDASRITDGYLNVRLMVDLATWVSAITFHEQAAYSVKRSKPGALVQSMHIVDDCAVERSNNLIFAYHVGTVAVHRHLQPERSPLLFEGFVHPR